MVMIGAKPKYLGADPAYQFANEPAPMADPQGLAPMPSAGIPNAAPIRDPSQHGFAGYIERLTNPDPNSFGGKMVLLSQALGRQLGSPLAAATTDLQQQRKASLLEQLKMAEYNKPEYRSGPNGSIYGIGRDGSANQVVAGKAESTPFERDLESAGFVRGSPDWMRLAQQRAQNQADPLQTLNNGDGTFQMIRPSQFGQAQPAPAGPPQAAVDYLRQNPTQAAAFDAKYGQGASSRAIGGAAPSGTGGFR